MIKLNTIYYHCNRVRPFAAMIKIAQSVIRGSGITAQDAAGKCFAQKQLKTFQSAARRCAVAGAKQVRDRHWIV